MIEQDMFEDSILSAGDLNDMESLPCKRTRGLRFDECRYTLVLRMDLNREKQLLIHQRRVQRELKDGRYEEGKTAKSAQGIAFI